MKILVTGGAGFIGSHTVAELIAKGHEPIIVDDLRNSEGFVLNKLEKLTGKKITYYPYDCGDMNLMREVFSKERPDGIIHFAAYKFVNESINHPLKYYENNVGSLVCLLKLVAEYPVSTFVFSSSCTVYGDPDLIPVTEKNPIKPPINPYGYTKQIGENCLKDFHVNFPEMSIVLLRYFNPIGAHPSAMIGELPIGVPSNLVPYVTQTAAGIREQLTINGNDYDTPDGTCVRDYIHVMDLAETHVLALEYAKSNAQLKIFNVGTGVGNSVLEVVKTFESCNKIKLDYTFGPRREGDASVVYSDNQLISKTLKWETKYSLEDALQHAWKWQQTL